MLPKTSLFLVLFTLVISCNKDYLEGIDRKTLFSEPTQPEIDAVRADWISRDLSPKNYQLVQQATIDNVGVLKIISFTVSGLKEYAALLIPPNGDDLPVRMFVYGFALDDPTTYANLQVDNLPFVFAVPALRGQALSITVNNKSYTTPFSEGNHCDAFDGATDDTITLLNIIESTEPRANTNRVSVRGGSRGATVALLAGTRDARVTYTVAIAGPSNMLTLTSVSENDDTYQCQFLQGLKNGTETISQVRHKMIASSPIYFASTLSNAQMHMAADDEIVPISQGTQLSDRMNALGLAGRFDLFIYEGRDHSTIANDNNEMNARIAEFLDDL